jgi:hypothetical protein
VLDRSIHNYSVADFLELRAAKRLVINRDFQRRSIWKTPAQVYLIDSILRGYPIPKMYFRSQVDPVTQSSVREVVDGQQRLLAIFSFADDDLRLTNRANEYAGMRYSDLDEELQAEFLAYTFVAEQLINASDAEVLEVFARINTYTVALNPAELRHAQFQGDFKWLVHELARRWEPLWSDFDVLSLSQRARMADDALVADMMLQVMQGPTGGEAKAIKRVYRDLDLRFDAADEVAQSVNGTLQAMIDHLSGALEPPLSNPPHLLMLFSATAHVLFGIGIAPIEGLRALDELPERPPAPRTQDEWECVRTRLLTLAEVIEQPDPPHDRELADFWQASRSRTINLASRRVRFPVFLKAFADL